MSKRRRRRGRAKGGKQTEVVGTRMPSLLTVFVACLTMLALACFAGAAFSRCLTLAFLIPFRSCAPHTRASRPFPRLATCPDSPFAVVLRHPPVIYALIIFPSNFPGTAGNLASRLLRKLATMRTDSAKRNEHARV